MSLLSRLFDALTTALGSPDRPDADDLAPAEHLAAAALLVHVARVDGTFAAPERERLLVLLESRFQLTRTQAERLMQRAGRVDHESADIAGPLEMMRGADVVERRRLLAMAYAVAAADGEMREFEDDLVWRLGRMLGLEEDEIAALKAGALARGAPDA